LAGRSSKEGILTFKCGEVPELENNSLNGKLYVCKRDWANWGGGNGIKAKITASRPAGRVGNLKFTKNWRRARDFWPN